ncbi:MAG: hypothetical protein ACXVZV_10315 [Terriglobales bacterium]
MNSTQHSRDITGPSAALTWTASLIACFYIIWTGLSLYLSLPSLINLYASIGVALPLAVRILIAGYPGLYFIIFGGASVLVIAKQFFVRDNRQSLTLTLATTLAAAIAANAMLRALYHPLLDVMNKLG